MGKVALATGVLLVVGGAAVGVGHWWHNYPVHRFGVVREGVLYRSAQPSGSEWGLLREKYGIRTVVGKRRSWTRCWPA